MQRLLRGIKRLVQEGAESGAVPEHYGGILDKRECSFSMNTKTL